MRDLVCDLRFSVRRLLARPLGMLVAIVTLSAGIGSVSTMYVLFRAAVSDLPTVPAAERVGRVFITDPLQRDGRIPPAPAERNHWIESPPRGVILAVVADVDAFVEPGGHSLKALRTTRAYFDVAAVEPELGRIFSPGEQAVIVSRRLWDLLAPAVRRLGATLTVDGQARAIVGVMPASFWMPVRGVDLWIAADDDVETGWPNVLVRLEAGASAEQAAAELSPVVQHLRGAGYVARVRLLATDAAVRTRTGMLVLVGPALLVLLAVCANVSALLLGDVHRRRQELAVRAALGASRSRLAREVFVDALAIAGLGGAVSLGAAYWSIRALGTAIAPVSADFAARLPTFSSVSPIATLTAVVAVLGVGYAPALFASRVNIVRDLAGTGPPLIRKGRYGSRDLLLVLQIAMAAGLVLWASLFVNLFDRVRAVPAHVPADRLWGIDITARPGAAALSPNVPALIQAQAAAAPGIEAAGVSESTGARRLWIAVSATGETTSCSASLQRVSGEFFAAHGFPLRGRQPRAGEAVLSEVAALRCANALTLHDATSPRSVDLLIVGSVDDRLMGAGIPRPIGPAQVYALLTEPTGRELTVKVRTHLPGRAAVGRFRDDLVKSIPDVRIAEPRSFAAEYERETGGGVLIGKLLAVLAALALLFGIVGLHAAIAGALSARTREIGIRVALGAAPRNVVGVTIGHHAAPATLGIFLGAALSIGGLLTLGTDDASLIRELALLATRSPATWGALLGLFATCALVSAALPVRRALRLDPAVVLRQD